jgi:glucokinase
VSGVVVGVDIGGSKIAVLARDASSNRKLYENKLKTPADQGVEAILKLLDGEIEKIPGGRSSLEALGIAIPGHVDDRGHVMCAGNLKGWVNVPLRSYLVKRYHVPAFVERDANCGAIGEKWRGAARSLEDFVFLALGTGVGAGLFVEGRLYRGTHHAAGEVGDLSFPGNKKTVGEVVGKRSIKKKVKRATGEKMTAAEALERAIHDRRLEHVTREVVDYLVSTSLAIISLLDPQAIIFGGGTSKAAEALLSRIRGGLPPLIARRSRLLPAGLGTQAQVYGALWGAENLKGSSERSRESESPVQQLQS